MRGLALVTLLGACKAPGEGGAGATTAAGWACLLGDEVPDWAAQLGCWDDFALVASVPLDASIPGARSVKTIVDRADDDALYFQNSERYAIHWEFAFAFLSGDGLPLVPDLGTFNATEYYSPERRFLLGAVTFYEEPGVWAYEISPYDTASADLIAEAFAEIKDNAWFGEDLYFHPTSEAVEVEAALLPDDVPVITTDELFADITYQPLNLGVTMGQLAFYDTDALEDQIPSFREIVVLDAVPNDISVVAGIVTDAFQTPLSHVNVLSQDRGTPNMALIGAYSDPELRALEGAWVELTVAPMDYAVREVTAAEADAWWDANKPDPIDIGPMDTSVTGLWDEDVILDPDAADLSVALSVAIPAFGGKASHFGGLATIGDAVPHPPAFAVPVYYYDRFMADNGLWDDVDAMLADPDFLGDAATRYAMLDDLRDAIEDATVDPALLALIIEKIEDGYASGAYSATRFRFRSSTNAEDVSGFSGAGLYDSKSGDPRDDDDPVEDAIRDVYASLWSDRAYEEREYYSIDHTDVGMALLCHPAYTDERANGVAITANVYDTSGLEPAFYVNVQLGEESVVDPAEGVTTDQLIYYYDLPGQPVVYIGHSSLVAEGASVLTAAQLYELGTALSAIHDRFAPVYGATGGFYGMDTEFKFDADPDTGEWKVALKQARPYPGWGSAR